MGSFADAGVATEAPAACRRALAHALFGGQQEYDHERWRRLLSSHPFRYRQGLDDDQRAELSYQRLRVLHETIGSPEELSGSPYLLTAMHEWTSIVDGALATVAGIHYNLFLGSLLDHDADERRDLKDFTELSRIGVFLCTELAHGNDAAALETTATIEPATDEFILHTPSGGARKYMPNTSAAGGPKSALVAARLLVGEQDHGVFLFLVPLSDDTGFLPGIQVSRLPERIGNPVDHCLTSFSQVRLPRHALLEGEHGRLAADGTLTSLFGSRRKRFLYSISRVTAGKACMSACAVGASRAALAIAVRYAHHRHITGPAPGTRLPLADLRSHHAPLVDALACVYAMTFLHRSVLRRWAESDEDDREGADRLIAIAKGWITWQARTIFTECRERCGAQGLFPVNRIADFAANVECAITAEGDNKPIWVKAAAEMIIGYQPTAVDRPDRPAADRELTDLAFLHDLLLHSEHIWHARARVALRAGPRGNSLGRWNTAVTPALAAVQAHARWQAAVAFMAAAENAADPAARSLLRQLCRLFMLNQVSGCTGDLLAEGYMTAEHVRQLHTITDTLIEDLAPSMMTLVEAFELPDEILADIPIANEDYLDYFIDDSACVRSGCRTMLLASREDRMGLAFERLGSGPPLVLLHGVGHRRQAWGAVLERLAPHRDVILVDLPGHGDSPPLRLAGRPVVGALLDAVVGLLDELALERPHVAGNSLGGRLALEAGVIGRAATVTALSPAGFWRSDREARYARAVFKVMESAAARTQRLAPLLSRTTAGRALVYGAIVSRPSRMSPEQARGDLAAFLGARDALGEILAGMTEFTGRIPAGVPVTIAWGSRDRLLPPRQGLVARDRLPQAMLLPLPGCGHVPMTDDPELVSDVLLRGSDRKPPG